jgi:ankyrin repeat protein
VAEDLLQRHAHDVSQIRPKSGLSRAFSSSNLKKGKNWEPSAVLQVLQTWIANGGSPGVAEALLAKLAAAGVDLGGMQKPKSGILNRRRSLESFVDRTKLLRSAVERDQLETAQVLLPHADPLALDGSLPMAIKRGNTSMVELLLRFGANVSQTAEGQDAFRQACSAHSMSEIIRLVLSSDGRPSTELASQSMVDAARAGLLDTVLHLARSIADGNHNQAEALQFAAQLGLRDVAIAIVMGNKPPQGQGLSEAFRILVTSTTLSPSTKLEIGELLLCAGAEGDVLAQALQAACETQFYEMASLLAAYGVSIEYNDAAVVKTAIQRGQLDLVQSLLNASATLNPTLASSCVAIIPGQVTNRDRYFLLDLLLRKGAKGTPIDEKLIDATRAGDIHTVDLLLKPFFPERNSGHIASVKGTQGASHRLRHEVASPDYKEGEALRTAVLRVDTVIAQKILASQPSGETLSKVFPLTKNLSAADRYDMVDLFLKGALSGPPLHAALQDAISQDVSTRDDNLIRLLLEFHADINYNQGEGLQAVIMQRDMALLEFLMQRAAPQTAAARVPGIMKVDPRQIRYNMMALMLEAGAAVGIEEVSAALLLTLQERPVDMELLILLLQRGNARVNSSDHSIIAQAIRNPDPKVLELILAHGKPSVETISNGLNEIASLPSTDGKAWKLRATLAKSNRKENVNRLLVTEVQSLTEKGSTLPSFAALKQLLDAGADPNAYKAASLCRAVEFADSPIMDMLLGCDKLPTPASLGLALRHALKIADPMDRLSFTKKLVTSGALPAEANEALLHVIKTYPNDQPLIEVLANVADTSGGEAMALSVTKESAEALGLLLTRSRSTAESRDTALQRVLSIRDRAKRRRMCQDLLKYGVSKEVTSKALQVAARDGDRELGDLLIAHGASISSNNGQAIIEACRGGSAEVLEVLLRADGNTHKATLQKGFQAATEIGDLNKRAVVFEKLLKKGVAGEPVDAQLLSAARYGDNGHQVLRVLLESGADPNHSNGDAIIAATSTAHIPNLELLLGLWDQESRQVRVTGEHQV